MHRYFYPFILRIFILTIFLTIFLSACSNVTVEAEVNLLPFVDEEKRSGEFVFVGVSKATIVLPSADGYPSNQLDIPATAFKVIEDIDTLNINGGLDLVPSKTTTTATATVNLYLVQAGQAPLSGTPLTKSLSLARGQIFSFGIEDIKNNQQMLTALETGDFIIAVEIALEVGKPTLDVVMYELTALRLTLQKSG